MFEGNPTGTKLELADCTEIENPARQYECYLNSSLLTKNPRHCQLVKGIGRANRCLTTMASELANATPCSFIREDKEFDRSKCLYQVAVKTNDSSLCSGILDR